MCGTYTLYALRNVCTTLHMQWWSGPHWYIHSHLVSDWADEGRGTDWCGWHNQVHQDPETRSSATSGEGTWHSCDMDEVDRVAHLRCTSYVHMPHTSPPLTRCTPWFNQGQNYICMYPSSTHLLYTGLLEGGNTELATIHYWQMFATNYTFIIWCVCMITFHLSVLHSLPSNSRTSMSTAMTFFLSTLIHSKDTPIFMNKLGSNEPLVQ